VPIEALPRVVPSSGEVATTSRDALGAEVPIAGIAGDQQAALFGQACYQAGDAKNTYGTGSFLLMNTGAKRPASRRLLATVAWDLEGKVEYALEGSIFTTGASVQWLRDGLGLFRKAAESERLARSVKDAGGVRFLPALAGLAAPHWDAEARGTFAGITRGTTSAHLTRAVLEATAYRSAEVLDAMQEDSGVEVKTLRVDGGGSENGFLMQFQADLLGVPVERPKVSETTALGAASLAALGAGVFASRKEVAKAWALSRRYTPRSTATEREERMRGWRDFVEKARALYA
jgi:glycerol kinase